MKHKKLIAAIIVTVVILVSIGVVISLTRQSQTQNATPATNVPSSQDISGKITRISDACHADGICSVTLDDSKMIVTGCGLMADGKTCKTYDQSKLHVGDQVNATVMDAGYGTYNLECDSCTIKAAGK